MDTSQSQSSLKAKRITYSTYAALDTSRPNEQGYKNCPTVKKMVKELRKTSEWKRKEAEQKDFLIRVSEVLGLPEPISLQKISGILF